ncbi:hypothetical protein ACG5V6_27900 [Streptomyces chitinivorans]|uniref:Uncharacterized protein n=1 Tax=Streptomyces chitinivorans TaxID=1257027 RepID=A0ABW7I1I2_9ACTN|nr:hypothetical protein [Streptomyces chitinivorans]MDH2412472.1 hypothetical protein [Streptomyces chitinivorans]
MSYSLYLMRFKHGEAVTMDGELFDEVIGPCVVKREPEHGFVLVRAEDGGEADVYATSGAELGLTSVVASHFSPGLVLDVIARLARRLGAVVVLQEGVALVPAGGRLEDLPEEIRPDAQVLTLSGAAIQAAIDRA